MLIHYETSLFFILLLLYLTTLTEPKKKHSKPNLLPQYGNNTFQACINKIFEYLQVWKKVVDSSSYGKLSFHG